jgi:hypothetical protein
MQDVHGDSRLNNFPPDSQIPLARSDTYFHGLNTEYGSNSIMAQYILVLPVVKNHVKQACEVRQIYFCWFSGNVFYVQFDGSHQS